jgi:hypothetical protein
MNLRRSIEVVILFDAPVKFVAGINKAVKSGSRASGLSRLSLLVVDWCRFRGWLGGVAA